MYKINLVGILNEEFRILKGYDSFFKKKIRSIMYFEFFYLGFLEYINEVIFRKFIKVFKVFKIFLKIYKYNVIII